MLQHFQKNCFRTPEHFTQRISRPFEGIKPGNKTLFRNRVQQHDFRTCIPASLRIFMKMAMLPQITLRPTLESDLETLFQFQLDQEARYLAAFMSKESGDKEAYIIKHSHFLKDPSINTQTILVDGVIAGSIAKFVMEGDTEITYWIDKKIWGKGIATAALRSFLSIENTRPIFGRVAFDNIGSQKVLEKCGFVKTGKDKGFANARQAEIDEFIYKLI